LNFKSVYNREMSTNDVLGFRSNTLVSTRNSTVNKNQPISFLEYSDNRQQIVRFDASLNYNPFTDTLSVGNISGLIDKVEINNNDDNANYKLTFSDGNNNLLDNNHLFYHPFFQQLKVESNNSQTYQFLLKNSGQSAGLQIKGAPAVTQYEANITHYLDILKIQNTGSDTEIEQVGSGTIYIYNANGSLTLNSSGNLVASGIYAGNGSLLTSLTTSNLQGLIQNNQLQNDSITIGSTIFNLGDTKTTLSGLTSVTSDLFDGKIYIEERTDNKDYSLLFSNIPLAPNNERLINTDTNIYWNPYLSTLTCYRLDGYATGLELQTFSNIKPFVFCDGGIISTQSVYSTTPNDLCWDNNNKRLGIGTANPQNNLHISGSGSSTVLMLENIEIGANEWGFHSMGSVRTGRLEIQSQGGTDTIPFTIEKSCPSHTLYLNSSGNVGIGTASPNYKLSFGETVTNTDFTNGKGLLSIYEQTSTGNYFYGMGVGSSGSSINTTSGLAFWGGTEGSPPSNSNCHLFIRRNDGNVGIGNANPQNKLDVVGGIISVNNSASTIQSYLRSDSLELGINQSTDNVSYIDFHATPSVDGNFRIIRNAGANGTVEFNNSGTGDLIFSTNSAPQMYIKSSGNVGIGTTNPVRPLDVIGAGYFQGFNIDVGVDHATGSSNGASFLTCRYNGTQIGDVAQSTTSSVVYNTTSDYRLKENVIEMPSMINKIKQLRPVQFNYLEDKQDSLGFIAHEFKEIFSNNAIVSGSKDNETMICKNCNLYESDCKCVDCECEMKPIYQSLDYGKITPICIKGIQELIKENEEQSKVNNNLLERIEAFKSRIDILEENQKKIIQKLNKLIDPNGWFENSI